MSRELRRETLAEISEELRNLSKSAKYCELQPTVFGKPIALYLGELADRINATEQNPGNAAAIRSALVRIVNWFDEGGWDEDAEEEMDSMLEAANTALAKPPRNCDVGTAEDWQKRFNRFCERQVACRLCPADGSNCGCRWGWLQMPYKKGCAK